MKKAAPIKRLALALLVLILLAVLVALFRPDDSSIGQTVTFSDGSKMRLKAVTHGTRHRYLGGGWKQRLLSLLPRKLAAKLGSAQAPATTDQPSIAFWFERI